MEPDAGLEMMIDAVATKYNVIDSTIICDDDLTIIAFSKWSSKESSNLQPENQWPRTLKGKNRERMHLSKCSRTNISFQSISQGPHPSLHCLPEI